jgi:diguanylate cyclase (GGDEF)-like protein
LNIHERDNAAQRRDNAAQERDSAAQLRDNAARDRDSATEERGSAAQRRDSAADERDSAADERDSAAQRRDSVADERDSAAQARDSATGDRVGAAEERDSAAQRRGSAADQRDSATEERDSAAQRRGSVAMERERADGLSVSEHEQAAGDREDAARDRGEGSRDRARAAQDREQAARDRARAGIDALTGALLRDRGLVDLQREIDRARRTDGRLVLAFVDVDGLKATNDLHGHAGGDQLLRDVGMALMTGLRSYDLVIRYGGDEFLCALTSTDVEGAGRRFDEMAKNLTVKNPQASVSVGLATLENPDTLDELIARADAALYAGRRRGRA